MDQLRGEEDRADSCCQLDEAYDESDEEASTWLKEITLLRTFNEVDLIPSSQTECIEPGKLQDPPVLSEILELAKEGIPQTKHNILVLNHALVGHLRNILHSLRLSLRRNRKEQEDISRFLLVSAKGNFKAGSLNFSKCALPFLEIDSFTPPPNQYALQKKMLGHISSDYFTGPSISWFRNESFALRDLVLNHIRDSEMNKLENRLHFIRKTGGDKKDLQKVERDIKLLNSETLVIDPAQVDWLQISASLVSVAEFSPDECEARWRYVAGTHVNRASWSREERNRLFELAQQYYFQNWEKISNVLGTGRTPFQCCFQLQGKYFSNTRPWTKKEDDRLLELIAQYSIGDYIPWLKINALIENRTSRQVRERYVYCLKPSRKGHFSAEEDKRIMAVAELCKGNWRGIMKYFPHRSNPALMRRYKILLKDRAEFTGDEDRLLLEAIATHGNNWDAVAEAVPGRLVSEVKQRLYSLKQFSQEVIQSIRKGGQSEKSEEELPYIRGEAGVWAVLQLMWEPADKNTTPKMVKGVSLKKMSVEMRELLRVLEFGYKHLFGPIFPQPRSPSDLQTLANRVRYLCTSLSITDDFSAVINRLKNTTNPQCRDSVLLSLEGMAPIPMSTSFWPSWVPPNVISLLGFRVLFSAKSCIFIESALGVTYSETWRDDRIKREDRLSSSDAKARLRSRIFRMFFISACLAKIKRKPVLLSYPGKVIKKRQFSKLRNKKHAKLMANARWRRPAEGPSSDDVPTKKAKMIHTSPSTSSTDATKPVVPKKIGRPRKTTLPTPSSL